MTKKTQNSDTQKQLHYAQNILYIYMLFPYLLQIISFFVLFKPWVEI